MPEGCQAESWAVHWFPQMSQLGTILCVMHLDDASVCACLLLISGLPGIWRSGSLVR